MSENEQFKVEAQRQFVEQRVTELSKYIDGLFLELQKAVGQGQKDSLLMLTMFTTLFLAILGESIFPSTWMSVNTFLANFLFWSCIAREWLFILPYRFGLMDELSGCFKTLEILGMLEKRDRGNNRLKKYKESWVAKMWEALKSKKIREAFA